MTQTMFIWSSVIAIVLLVITFRSFQKFRESNNHSTKSVHFIEIAPNKEIFYCPGDEKRFSDDFSALKK